MLRGIQIELWEDGFLSDTKLATVYTVESTNDAEYGLSTSTNYVDDSNVWHHVDNSGYFKFENIYVGSGGKDVFLRVVFIGHDGGDGTTDGGTEKLAIHDDTVLIGWDIPYFQTVTFHLSSEEETGILLLQTPDLGTDGLADEAAHIYYDIWKTYGYFRDAISFVNDKIDAYIDLPDTSAPDCEGDRINFDGWTNDYLTYERTSSFIHEYSHSIMYNMYGNTFPTYAPGDINHGGCANSNSVDALIEGWARFIPPVILKNNIYEWSSTSNTWDIDSNTGNNYASCDDKEEWVYGAILYDLWKDIDEKLVWIKYISNTFNDYNPSLVQDFYNDLTDEFGYIYNVWTIFNNHGVTYNSVGSSGGPDSFGY